MTRVIPKHARIIKRRWALKDGEVAWVVMYDATVPCRRRGESKLVFGLAQYISRGDEVMILSRREYGEEELSQLQDSFESACATL